MAQKKWNLDNYTDELNRNNRQIKPLENFTNCSKPIKHKCLVCDNVWKTSPIHILSGSGCPKCAILRNSKKQSLGNDGYLKLLKKKNINIIPLEEYQNIYKPILHKCNVCSYEWNITPKGALKGTGCPKCKGRLPITTNEYRSRLQNLKTGIEYIDNLEIIKLKGSYKHKCTVCGTEWNGIPRNILNGSSCPKCMAQKRGIKTRYTAEQYKNKIALINPNVELIGNYEGTEVKTLHRCKKCGSEWMVTPHEIISGYGCVICNYSKNAIKIKDFLTENKIEFYMEKTFEGCKNKRLLRFDFYIPSMNLCIEYDGAQHYKPIELFGGKSGFEKTKKRDEIKNKFCEDNDINLLRLKYDCDVIDILRIWISDFDISDYIDYDELIKEHKEYD